MKLREFVIFLLKFSPVLAIYVEIQRGEEFEHVLTEDQDGFWVWRSEASSLKTLRLVDFNQTFRVEFDICIEPIEGVEIVTLYLDDIRYANDGPNDTIFVTFEGNYWDEYSTYEKWAHGHEWNIFRNTGRVNETKYLTKGVYVIGVSVETDKWGIELDRIRLIAEYQELHSSIFCGGRLINTSEETDND